MHFQVKSTLNRNRYHNLKQRYHSFETRPGLTGRPGLGTGPSLSKNQPGIWPRETRLTRANPTETRPYTHTHTHTREMTSFWPFTVKRPKRLTIKN
jgi:hypothetical protein